MSEMERLREVREGVGDFCGSTLQGVEVGVVPFESGIGGPQQFIELTFSKGKKVRLETRSGFKDEGGFFVVKNGDGSRGEA